MATIKNYNVMQHSLYSLVSLIAIVGSFGCTPNEMPVPNPDREQPGIVPAPPWKPNPVPSRGP